MKLTCDLCGSELIMHQGGAVCGNCGIEYSTDRLHKKMAHRVSTVHSKQSDRQMPPPVKKPAATEQGKMKIMWMILAVIALVAFVGGLTESTSIIMICLAAVLITLLVFRPWSIYGGNAL